MSQGHLVLSEVLIVVIFLVVVAVPLKGGIESKAIADRRGHTAQNERNRRIFDEAVRRYLASRPRHEAVAKYGLSVFVFGLVLAVVTSSEKNAWLTNAALLVQLPGGAVFLFVDRVKKSVGSRAVRESQ